MKRLVRLTASATMLAFATATTAAIAAPFQPHRPHADTVVMKGSLPDGRGVAVYSNGLAQISDPRHRTFSFRPLPYDAIAALDDRELPQAKQMVLAALSRTSQGAYVPGRVLLAFRSGTSALTDLESIPRSTILARRAATPVPFPYTTDGRVNEAFAKLGVDQVERIGREFSRARLEALGARRTGPTRSPIDPAGIYRIHVTDSSVESAVRLLSTLNGVVLAEPDYTVAAMDTGMRAPATQRQWARSKTMRSPLDRSGGLPQNYGTVSGLQAYENAPGVDSLAAYDEIQRQFKQLPGTGEIVTDVAFGDLDDPSALYNRQDPCWHDVQLYGSTTNTINGKRYLDLPSMPLIPVYVSNGQGKLSRKAEVCGIDPSDSEIGLDFSVMAPLPHDMQRPNAQGGGLDDLLGIAPGAKYRLVAPDSTASSDLLAALLAAAQQVPAPNVITTSIGFGSDAVGFPSRYLEDDPISQSVVQTIVDGMGIVVSIAANDGLRTETNAPVNPSGGSTPTEVASSSAAQTNLDDLYYSTAPSYDVDTGAIDAGGTTLDDIYSANPLDPAIAQRSANSRTWPETRWNGFASFSSGYGKRVDLSAPSDNIVSMEHYVWNFSTYNKVTVGLEGGTSAAAPMIAAAAAIALQVARLTGHPLATPQAVRKLLVATATRVMPVPQADGGPHVGPQVSVRGIVEKLLQNTPAGRSPKIAGVAIMQRRSADLAPATSFYEDTDPANIDLQDADEGYGGTANSDEGVYMPITIAPDWEFLPRNAAFRLYAAGRPSQILSRQPYARLYPAQILGAAGLPVVSSSERTVKLTYAATQGFHTLVQGTVALTFGPADASAQYVPPPIVPSTVTKNTLSVKYDFSNFPSTMLGSPALVISYPGRMLPAGGSPLGISPPFKWIYGRPLSSNKGTVNVPVSALDGAGVYSVAVELNTTDGYFSDLAYTRISSGDARPAAPLLSSVPALSSRAPSHALAIPYGASFGVTYDVSNVPGATGAILEFSAAAPTLFGNDNTFNNPQGSRPDDNGVDTGSLSMIQLSGTKGTIVVSAAQAKLVPTLTHTARLIPVSGTTAVGEAGDVSTIAEAGIVAPDGGGFQDGYFVNPSGDDAVYTSNQTTASGDTITSFGIFAQDTGATQPLLSGGTGGSTYSLPGAGILGSDLAFLEYSDPAQSAYAFQTIANVGTYTAGSPPHPGTWNPPALPTGESTIAAIGTNASATTTAFLVDAGLDQDSTQRFYAFSDNPASSAPTPVTNISASLGNFNQPVAYGFDYDPATTTAYAAADDGYLNGCKYEQSQFMTVSFAGSATTVSAQALPGAGFVFDLAIDPKTQIAAIPSFCDVVPSQIDIANLADHTMTNVALSQDGWEGANVAADPVNSLFLVEQPIPDTIDLDSNAMSQIDVLNEAGVLQKIVRPFSFPVLLAGNHFLGVNGTTRRGFAFGPPPTVDSAVYYQLEPFSY